MQIVLLWARMPITLAFYPHMRAYTQIPHALHLTARMLKRGRATNGVGLALAYLCKVAKWLPLDPTSLVTYALLSTTLRR